MWPFQRKQPRRLEAIEDRILTGVGVLGQERGVGLSSLPELSRSLTLGWDPERALSAYQMAVLILAQARVGARLRREDDRQRWPLLVESGVRDRMPSHLAVYREASKHPKTARTRSAARSSPENLRIWMLLHLGMPKSLDHDAMVEFAMVLGLDAASVAAYAIHGRWPTLEEFRGHGPLRVRLRRG